MLRMLNRHLNETVFRGPDDELGSGTDTVDVADTGGSDDAGSDDSADGGADDAPSKPLTVREQLKASIDEVRALDEGRDKPKRGKRSASTADVVDKTAAPAKDAAAPAADPAAAPTTPDIPAPASLSQEAKAAWEKAPKEIKEAFVKREADMQKGVEELKQRYNMIDQAIAPHNDALRQMNATPAEAVDRMFLWFKALAGTPASSFPALAQSMGIDWGKLMAATNPAAQQGGQQPAPVDAAAQEGAPEVHPQVREYIGRLEQQIQNLQQNFQQVGGRFQSMEEHVQQQNAARTAENLNIWSKDKPHFEEVRSEMAHLLQSGMIPLKSDGQVDLDKAYEHAIYINPTVRAKVIAEQQQADLKARQDAEAAATAAKQSQTEKAKKAAVSISARTTPGAGNASLKGPQAKPGAKTSVRDSLKAAISELRDQ